MQSMTYGSSKMESHCIIRSNLKIRVCIRFNNLRLIDICCLMTNTRICQPCCTPKTKPTRPLAELCLATQTIYTCVYMHCIQGPLSIWPCFFPIHVRDEHAYVFFLFFSFACPVIHVNMYACTKQI